MYKYLLESLSNVTNLEQCYTWHSCSFNPAKETGWHKIPRVPIQLQPNTEHYILKFIDLNE